MQIAHGKYLGSAVHACDPTTGEAETGGPLVLTGTGRVSKSVSSSFSERPYLNIYGRKQTRKTLDVGLWYHKAQPTNQKHESHARWRTPLVSALGRQSKQISASEANLIYILISRTAKVR